MFTEKDRFIVIDTETANCGDKEMKDPLCYDIGFAVINREGKVYERYSFVVAEVFYSNLMDTAYFKNKIPQYIADIESGSRKVRDIITIWKIFNEVCKRNHINIVIAHNAAFDCRSLNKTLRYLSGSKYRYFLPFGVEWWDSLKMAREVLNPEPEYYMFCEYYGYFTKHKRPQLRFTAEIVFRFITDNIDFIESHTGLEDVLIEKDIFCYCLNRQPNINGKLWND